MVPKNKIVAKLRFYFFINGGLEKEEKKSVRWTLFPTRLGESHQWYQNVYKLKKCVIILPYLVRYGTFLSSNEANIAKHSRLKKGRRIMKFSPRKKAKMRKIRLRQIRKSCKDMIGCCINHDTDSKVIDQATINGVVYLLVEDFNYERAIYKVLQHWEFVKLSPKKVLALKSKFSNYEYWKRYTTIYISEDGEIESIRRGTIFGPYNKKPEVIFIELEVM